MLTGLAAPLALLTAFLTAPASNTTTTPDASFLPPPRVTVLPVFFVPTDQKDPTSDEQALLMKHLVCAQARYKVMLNNLDTFEIASQPPVVYHAKFPLSQYKASTDSLGAQCAGEMLAFLKLTRFNCPYVFVNVMMSPEPRFPNGCGRCLNGGFNTGGGSLEVSSTRLDDKDANFQGLLQHELGHSFGLPHVDAYGFSMDSDTSIMSYNKSHHYSGFKPSPTPGILNPEDLRALALNRRVFPDFKYRVPEDVPAGHTIYPDIRFLGPVDMTPPYRFKVATTSGDATGSKVSNLAKGVIEPDTGTDAGKGFDKKTMWQSKPQKDGRVTVTVTFPESVTLSGLTVHSECGGKLGPAQSVAIEAGDPNPTTIGQSPLSHADAYVSFTPTTSATWRLVFQAGASHAVVLRGLQFYTGLSELVPPLIAPEAYGAATVGPGQTSVTPHPGKVIVEPKVNRPGIPRELRRIPVKPLDPQDEKTLQDGQDRF